MVGRLRSHGVTLVELLVVITLLGIVAVVALPDFRSGELYRLELAAREFAEAMRFARGEAIRTGEPHGFRQASGPKRIQVFRPDISTTPWTLNYDVYHPVSKQLYDIELDTHPFAAADSVTHNRVYRGSCNIDNNVYFDNTGTPWCVDPETVLLQQFELTLTLGGHTKVVTLHGITGRVTVQ